MSLNWNWLVNLCRDVVSDQRAIWTNPWRMANSSATIWLLYTPATGALILLDTRITRQLPRRREELAISRWASRLGTSYTMGLAAGAVLVGGCLRNDEHAVRVALLALRTIADTALVAKVVKLATQRPRPSEGNGRGRFGRGGDGFPSGHSMNSWALAALLSREFPSRRIGAISYGIALTVSLARLFGRRHFASDAFAGAIAGWYIGKHVQRCSLTNN